MAHLTANFDNNHSASALIHSNAQTQIKFNWTAILFTRGNNSLWNELAVFWLPDVLDKYICGKPLTLTFPFVDCLRICFDTQA